MKTAGIPRELEQLQYPPAGYKPYPSKLARGAGFVLAAAVAAITGGLALSQALSGAPIAGPGGLWGSVLFLGGMAVFAALLSLIPLRIRGFRVWDGVMTLVTPVRAVSGERIRHLPLARIKYAERIAQAGADPGIIVTLKDGTRFPVFEADLRHGGHSFLERLMSAVGGPERGGIAASETGTGGSHTAETSEV